MKIFNFTIGIFITTLLMVGGILFTQEANAQIRETFTYQMKVVDTNYIPPVDGTYNFRFRIYDSLAGGLLLWEETHSGGSALQITNGVMTVELNSICGDWDAGGCISNGGVDFSSDSLYLQVEWDADGAGGTFEEVFTPRRRLTAAAYAQMAAGLTTDLDINFTDGQDNSIQWDEAAERTLTIENDDASNVANLAVEGQIQTGSFASAPTALGNGAFYYDTGSNELFARINGSWESLGGAGAVTLDSAYNNFGASASTITIDAAESQTGGLQFVGSLASDETISITNSANGGVLFVENTGTGDSFRVNDESSDTSPFVIDDEGNVGIGTATPSNLLEITGGNARFNDNIAVGNDARIGADTAAAETLNNAGFTLDGDDLFVADSVGVEGSIYTDGVLQIDRAEDVASITLNDTTNVDSVSLYTGTGTPNGALSAQAGSLFLDQGGEVYVNTDGGTSWSVLNNSGNSLDDAYNNGSDVTVDTTDVIWDLTSTNDFIIQDNGAAFFTFNDDDSIDYITDLATSAAVEFTGNSLTSGDLFQLNATALTSGDVLQVTANGTTTGYGINIVSGGLLVDSGPTIIDQNSTEAFLVRQDADGGDVFIVDTTNQQVGVNTAPSDDLEINASGDLSGVTISGADAPQLHILSDSTSATNAGQILFTESDQNWGFKIRHDASGPGGGDQLEFIGLLSAVETTAMIIEQNGLVGIGSLAVADTQLHVEDESAATNTSLSVLRLTHTSSGTPASGLGVGLEFEVEDVGDNTIAASIEGILTDVTDSSENGALVFYTQDAADDGLAERMRIDTDGQVGIGTNSPGSLLEVDGTAAIEQIDLDDLTSNPSASEGLVWFRSDTDNLSLYADGRTQEVAVTEIGQFYDSDGNGGTFNVNTATYTAIPWDSETFAEDATYSHDTVTNNSQITINDDGLYKISYQINLEGDGSRKTVRCAIRLDGTTVLTEGMSYSYSRNNTDQYASNTASAMVSMNATQYYEIVCQQAGSGGNSFLADDTATEGASWTSIELLRRE